MNGLQPVLIRACKRFRCLPTCPLGTRGIVLSRRLAQEQVRNVALGDANPAGDPVNPARPTPSARWVLSGEDTIRPNPRAAVPLDRNITGVTPLSVELREAPIRRLLRAIDRRQDTAIWRYFQAICAAGMTRRLSAADYSSILLSLRPARYVSLRARHYLNDQNEARLMAESYSYEEFRRRLQLVSMGMQANGYSLSVLEYTHLLDCARAGEDIEMAEKLWNQMSGQEGVSPDTWAYNTYMAAMCGTASTERELRVTERTVAQRSAITDENVRARAITVYKRMIDRGITPNSMTFDVLMLAMARMGDIHSVRRTLKQVWDVDVDSLGTRPETPESMEPAMDRDSPLYPREHTLVAVAAAFGSNNDVETAIRAVDHISRRYKIKISVAAWTVLLNWTYVFTRPPTHILPNFSVMNLWRIMIAAPYNIKLTLEMYDYLVRSLISRKMAPDAETMINRGLKAFSRIIRRAENSEEVLLSSLQDFPDNGLSYDAIIGLKREVAIARREEFRGRSIIRRWIELLCLGKGMRPDHSRIRVPNVIRKMQYFLGEQIAYVTPSGYIILHLGKEQAWRPISFRRRKRQWTPLGTGAKEEDYLD